jgi:hypothetical protein
MASVPQPRIRKTTSSKAAAKVSQSTPKRPGNTLKFPVGTARAKRVLLHDLMGDLKRCLANKSRTEQKAVAVAISKLARS